MQKLERDRHLALDRIPSPAAEAPREDVDFLSALRAEHQALLAQELGSISLAQALRHEEKDPTVGEEG